MFATKTVKRQPKTWSINFEMHHHNFDRLCFLYCKDSAILCDPSLSIIGMVKVCTVKIKLPKQFSQYIFISTWAGCKTAYNNDIHKDHLTP